MFTMHANRIALAAVLVAGAIVTAGSARPRDAEPTPTTRRANAAPVFCGRWSYGSISPTTYWNAATGAFAGNARGSAGILEFDDRGGYTQYGYLELRTYNLTTKAWTVHAGDVTVEGDRLTLTPRRGHYQSWIGDRSKTDRAMTADECARLARTYRWTLAHDDAGRELLTIPFDDGSRFEYRRADR